MMNRIILLLCLLALPAWGATYSQRTETDKSKTTTIADFITTETADVGGSATARVNPGKLVSVTVTFDSEVTATVQVKCISNSVTHIVYSTDGAQTGTTFRWTGPHYLHPGDDLVITSSDATAATIQVSVQP